MKVLGANELPLRQGFRLWRKRLYGAKAPPRRAGPHIFLASILFPVPKQGTLHLQGAFFLATAAMDWEVSNVSGDFLLERAIIMYGLALVIRGTAHPLLAACAGLFAAKILPSKVCAVIHHGL